MLWSLVYVNYDYQTPLWMQITVKNMCTSSYFIFTSCLLLKTTSVKLPHITHPLCVLNTKHVKCPCTIRCLCYCHHLLDYQHNQISLANWWYWMGNNTRMLKSIVQFFKSFPSSSGSDRVADYMHVWIIYFASLSAVITWLIHYN